MTNETSTDPPWLRIALGEVGVRYHPGGPNERIKAYLATVSAQPGDNWCAGFAAWCLAQAGYSGHWTAAARSFLHVGEPIAETKPGSIVVLWRISRDNWRGHVGFLISETPKSVVLVSGNSGGGVRVSSYPKERVLGRRWPS